MPSEETSRVIEEVRRTDRWQRQLLPFMMMGIAIMGLFFFIASLFQLYYLHSQVGHRQIDLGPVFAAFEKQDTSGSHQSDLQYLRLKTAVLLEQDVVARRYHQVNSAMLARVWTRYLGFVTGMILALVGAIFSTPSLRAGSEICSVRAPSPGPDLTAIRRLGWGLLIMRKKLEELMPALKQPPRVEDVFNPWRTVHRSVSCNGFGVNDLPFDLCSYDFSDQRDF